MVFILSVPVNVPPQSLISYNNEDGGNSFTHLITQTREDIDHFSLVVVNEKGQEITNMTDYIILLQFQKVFFIIMKHSYHVLKI